MSTKEKNMDERIAFGNSLSEKRRESGFSQEELGLKIGKSSNAVSRYENAENTMDVHTFAKTVNALKASPYELLKDLEAPEPDSKIVSLFFQIQRLDKNKKKFALSMVESMQSNQIQQSPEQQKKKPELANWQKVMDNGEYLRSAEMAEEANYNMLDGLMNNTPKKKDKNAPRRSVLKRLRKHQQKIASQGKGQPQQQRAVEERKRI